MYDGIRSQGGVSNGGFVYCIYFVLLVLFGNCILYVKRFNLRNLTSAELSYLDSSTGGIEQTMISPNLIVLAEGTLENHKGFT